MAGPLSGLKVVELVGQGPGPYGSALLADMGCDVVSVDRAAAGDTSRPATSPFMRGKRSVVLDLKQADEVARMVELIERADVFIDPFRPGVCERLGIGPDEMLARNPGLIYARMTGFGQTGPLAMAAGHDLNYIALSGALHCFGYEGQPPTMPINVLGDFAGGGLLMAYGIAAAAFERSRSGQGQVIDVSMVEGATTVLGPFLSAVASGFWGPRGTNHLDGGAHFYNVYETADGRWVSVGAIEPQFYAELMARIGLEAGDQWDRATWPARKVELAGVFASKSRDEWCDLLEGTETCFAPVLSPAELAQHPHIAARGGVVERHGVPLAKPAPHFSRTPGEVGTPVHPGTSTVTDILATW